MSKHFKKIDLKLARHISGNRLFMGAMPINEELELIRREENMKQLLKREK